MDLFKTTLQNDHTPTLHRIDVLPSWRREQIDDASAMSMRLKPCAALDRFVVAFRHETDLRLAILKAGGGATAEQTTALGAAVEETDAAIEAIEQAVARGSLQ